MLENTNLVEIQPEIARNRSMRDLAIDLKQQTKKHTVVKKKIEFLRTGLFWQMSRI